MARVILESTHGERIEADAPKEDLDFISLRVGANVYVRVEKVGVQQVDGREFPLWVYRFDHESH